jgi:hypothetical protein
LYALFLERLGQRGPEDVGAQAHPLSLSPATMQSRTEAVGLRAAAVQGWTGRFRPHRSPPNLGELVRIAARCRERAAVASFHRACFQRC